jgi:hypothetical protein
MMTCPGRFHRPPRRSWRDSGIGTLSRVAGDMSHCLTLQGDLAPCLALQGDLEAQHQVHLVHPRHRIWKLSRETGWRLPRQPIFC